MTDFREIGFEDGIAGSLCTVLDFRLYFRKVR
jgi:hypothetical protein